MGLKNERAFSTVEKKCCRVTCFIHRYPLHKVRQLIDLEWDNTKGGSGLWNICVTLLIITFEKISFRSYFISHFVQNYALSNYIYCGFVGVASCYIYINGHPKFCHWRGTPLNC